MPPLHIKLGLVNRAFMKSDGYSYFSWSQKRIENVPTNEVATWNLVKLATQAADGYCSDLIVFNHVNNEVFKELKEKLKSTKRESKNPQLGEDKSEQMSQNIIEIESSLKELNEAKNKIESKLKEKRGEVRALKRLYKEEVEKRTWKSRLVQNQKEILLREIGVDRGASHGGDLQGRGCTKLLQNANTFFEGCIKIDLEAVHNGTSVATEHEA